MPRSLNIVTLLLVIVGALNWLLVGAFEYDLVAAIAGGLDFGETNAFSRVIYVVVGIAGVAQLANLASMMSSRASHEATH